MQISPSLPSSLLAAQFNQKPQQDPTDEVRRGQLLGMPNRVEKAEKEVLGANAHSTLFCVLGFSLSRCHRIVSHLISPGVHLSFGAHLLSLSSSLL